jgi:ElaB/YqjD/DUF883 family membrane-anchored ribosome-binding protein
LIAVDRAAAAADQAFKSTLHRSETEQKPAYPVLPYASRIAFLRAPPTYRRNLMNNASGAKARVKTFDRQTNQSADAGKIRNSVENLRASVGHMARRQTELAQDMAADTLHKAGSSIGRNPLTAIGIGLGVGFLLGLMMGRRDKPISRTAS